MLLQKRGLKLNPITSLYYISPCCFVFLAFPWAFLELPKLLNSPEPVRTSDQLTVLELAQCAHPPYQVLSCSLTSVLVFSLHGYCDSVPWHVFVRCGMFRMPLL